MALKPEQISGLREAFSAIARPINDWLLQDAAERIAAAGALAGEPAGKMTATASYEIYRAKVLGESQRELKKFLKRQLGFSNREIRRLFRKAARMSGQNDEVRVGLTSGADIEQMAAAAIKLAQQDFTNLTQTLGMMAPGGKVLPLHQFYQKSMDFAFKQIFTGAADYETAIRQATTKMADAGVRTIDYASGRSTSLEAAVRRNMMGGMGLLNEQITQTNHDALGCNGWEISAHANSAPDHEPIQGHQYSDKDFRELESRLVRRIGTLNCGHVKMPILLGINSPQYTEEQLRAFQEENAKGITYEGKHYTGYEATQKQRQIECAMQVQKNRILVSRSTGDALREQTAQIRLQMLSQHYKAFSKAAGLPLQDDRAWVAGFGPKQAKEAAEIYREQTLTNAVGQLIIKVKKSTVRGPANGITQKVNAKGGIDRNYYDSEGKQTKQISNNGHGHKKEEAMGINGEHAHDYEWDENGHPIHIEARELTTQERVENDDIINHEKNDKRNDP